MPTKYLQFDVKTREKREMGTHTHTHTKQNNKDNGQCYISFGLWLLAHWNGWDVWRRFAAPPPAVFFFFFFGWRTSTCSLSLHGCAVRAYVQAKSFFFSSLSTYISSNDLYIVCCVLYSMVHWLRVGTDNNVHSDHIPKIVRTEQCHGLCRWIGTHRVPWTQER